MHTHIHMYTHIHMHVHVHMHMHMGMHMDICSRPAGSRLPASQLLQLLEQGVRSGDVGPVEAALLRVEGE